jgi:hypothetical protein
MSRRLFRAATGVGLLALALLSPLAARAGEEAVLTVTPAPGAAARALSLAEIEAMGAVELRTATPWTEGEQVFLGVPGANFVAALGLSGTEVSAVAVNDYRIAIPFEVFADPDTLIAYARNGKAMTVRDKGPLWIVFPFDSDGKFLTDTYKSYAIWSLTRVDIR